MSRTDERSPEKDSLRWHWLTFRQPKRMSSSQSRLALKSSQTVLLRSSSQELQTVLPTVICCIHPLILPLSKPPSRSLNFLDFGVYVVMTPIFPINQRKCVISSRIVAILILLSTLLNTVLNSQHCKRHRRKRMREFHLHSLITHITSQPKTSF